MSDYAEDAAALLATVGWDASFVIGVSFGGMVAQELALRYPDRVTRLVLCCSSSGGAGGDSYPIEKFFDLPMPERMRRQLPIQDIRRTPEWQASHNEEFEALISRGGTAWNRRQLEARSTHDTFERLQNLRMPVLTCGGHYDGGKSERLSITGTPMSRDL